MAVLGQAYDEKELHKNRSSVYAIESEGFKGQAVLLDDVVVHVHLMRK